MKRNISSEKSRVDDTVSTLLESLPDAVYLIDLKGVILNTNTLFASHIGMTPQECIGANIYDLLINVVQLPELADYHREKCQEVLRTGKRVVFADERDVRKVTISPVVIAEGEITRLLITIQNISEQKHIDKELHQERALKTALLDSIPCSAIIFDANLRIIVRNKYAQDLLSIATDSARISVKANDFFGSEDMGFLRKKYMETITSGIDYSREIKVYPQGDTEPMWLLTKTSRIFIEGKPCGVSIGVDITERKKMELDLIESKQRYTYALNAASSGIWEWDVTTDTLSWSEQVWKLYGIKVNSVPLNNQLCIDTIHPEDREMASRIIRDAVSNGIAASLEYRTIHPDGSVHWLTSRGMPMHDADGRVIRYIGAIIDITERKQIETELLENKTRLTFALDATKTGVWEWDVSADNVKWTDNVWELYGLEKNSLPHTHRLCESNIHPDDRDLLFEKVMAAASKEIEINIEYRVCHKDGSIHWLMCRGLPKYNADGQLKSYIGTVSDITPRKELMNQLLDSKTRLSLALDAARAGVWEWNLKTGTNVWSDETWVLYGLEKSDKIPSFELWTQTIHPDDREQAIKTVSVTTENEEELYVEYRLSNFPGSQRWALSRGKPLYDRHGNLERYIGTIIDITERKIAEENSRMNRERLDFILEKSHVGVWDLKMQDDTTATSLEHARIFGYDTIPPFWSLEKFFDHIIPEDRDGIETLIRSTIKNKENYAFECRIHTAKGELRWVNVTGAFKFDNVSETSHVLGIVQDITDQKKVKSELHESEAKFRTIFEYSPIAIGIGDISAGVLHDVNQAWLDLFGFTKEEVIGRNIRDLDLFAQVDDHNSIVSKLEERRKILNSKFHLKKKSGETATILFSSEFILLNQKQALLVMMTDISVQELQQYSIERLEQIVADRTQQLNLEVKRLKGFLHMISHEYRTPLAIIRGNIDLIQLKNKHANVVKPVEITKIQRAIDRLVEVMDESMHESRFLESRKVPIKPVQLVPIITSQVESFLALWPDQEIEYSGNLKGGEIFGDPSQLKIAIFNLLDNARKYSPPDSVIELECCQEGDEAVIRIRNQSTPITKGEAEVLFEKYHRGRNSMNTGGAGLGLWMVKTIIQEHNGQISLEGIASGVEISIRLPLFHQPG